MQWHLSQGRKVKASGSLWRYSSAWNSFNVTINYSNSLPVKKWLRLCRMCNCSNCLMCKTNFFLFLSRHDRLLTQNKTICTYLGSEEEKENARSEEQYDGFAGKLWWQNMCGPASCNKSFTFLLKNWCVLRTKYGTEIWIMEQKKQKKNISSPTYKNMQLYNGSQGNWDLKCDS